ncbi:MAG: O-antigen ligase family protein [Candidatus Omnitrophica bacterium]|nr:O-antigen ligase family protein [Candidatus Omnitrophota bacterium]MCM8826705.1 O-antigen ligase family protein [Candidatus Omnitrophota bacterium]
MWWNTILTCIFIRPFLSEITYRNLDLILNSIFLISSLFYVKNRRKLEFTSLDKTIILFSISLLISLFLSTNFLNSLKEIYKYFSLIILFFIVRTADKEEKRTLLFIIILSALLINIYSLYSLFFVSRYVLNYLNKHRISFPFAEEFLFRQRAFVPFISPNLLANYLVMVIIICLGLIIQKIKRNNIDNLILLTMICLSICLLSLFFTKSIGGFLTLFFSLLLLFLIKKKYLPLITIILISLLTITIIRTKTDKDFTTPLFSLQKRLSYWDETISVIKGHPIRGVGIGNFILKETLSAHNSYLQIWAEMGMLSLISWLTMAGIVIKNIKTQLNLKELNYYHLGLTISGLAFFIHNLIDFSFFIPQASHLWWVIIALTQTNHLGEQDVP